MYPKTSSNLQSSSSNPGTTVMSSTTWPPSSSIQRSHAWTIWHGVVWKSGTLPNLSKKKRPSGSRISEPPQKKNVFPKFPTNFIPKFLPWKLLGKPPPTTSHTRAVLDWLKRHSILRKKKRKSTESTAQWNQWNDCNMNLWLWTIFHHVTPSINKTPHLFGQVGRCIHRLIQGSSLKRGKWRSRDQAGAIPLRWFFSKTTKNSCDFYSI